VRKGELRAVSLLTSITRSFGKWTPISSSKSRRKRPKGKIRNQKENSTAGKNDVESTKERGLRRRWGEVP